MALADAYPVSAYSAVTDVTIEIVVSTVQYV